MNQASGSAGQKGRAFEADWEMSGVMGGVSYQEDCSAGLGAGHRSSGRHSSLVLRSSM